MNRAQLRAKAERRRMRDELIKGRSGWDAHIGHRQYNTFLFMKGWRWNDPKKINKQSPWIRTKNDMVKHMNREYARIKQSSTFWSS